MSEQPLPIKALIPRTDYEGSVLLELGGLQGARYFVNNRWHKLTGDAGRSSGIVVSVQPPLKQDANNSIYLDVYCPGMGADNAGKVVTIDASGKIPAELLPDMGGDEWLDLT